MKLPFLKVLILFFIFLITTAPLNAKNPNGVTDGENNKTTAQKRPEKPPILVSYGINFSSYLGEKGEGQLGYSHGLTVNFRIYKNLSMTLPFSYTRINAALENVEGKTDADLGENVYKTLSDWQISAVFFEVPLLFTYKFPTKNSYDFGFVFGPGLAFAIKDYSKLKFTRTDEILEISRYGASIDPETHKLRSALNIITGVRFHINRFYLDLLYTFYPEDIKGIYKLHGTSQYPHGIKSINNLNSISLKLGIDISSFNNVPN